MVRLKPLDDGYSTMLDNGDVTATFALGRDLDGYLLAEASVDETGYFITILFKKQGDGSD